MSHLQNEQWCNISNDCLVSIRWAVMIRLARHLAVYVIPNAYWKKKSPGDRFLQSTSSQLYIYYIFNNNNNENNRLNFHSLLIFLHIFFGYFKHMFFFCSCRLCIILIFIYVYILCLKGKMCKNYHQFLSVSLFCTSVSGLSVPLTVHIFNVYLQIFVYLYNTRLCLCLIRLFYSLCLSFSLLFARAHVYHLVGCLIWIIYGKTKQISSDNGKNKKQKRKRQKKIKHSLVCFIYLI